MVMVENKKVAHTAKKARLREASRRVGADSGPLDGVGVDSGFLDAFCGDDFTMVLSLLICWAEME